MKRIVAIAFCSLLVFAFGARAASYVDYDLTGVARNLGISVAPTFLVWTTPNQRLLWLKMERVKFQEAAPGKMTVMGFLFLPMSRLRDS